MQAVRRPATTEEAARIKKRFLGGLWLFDWPVYGIEPPQRVEEEEGHLSGHSSWTATSKSSADQAPRFGTPAVCIPAWAGMSKYVKTRSR